MGNKDTDDVDTYKGYNHLTPVKAPAHRAEPDHKNHKKPAPQGKHSAK
jgi:hypothetical protein